MHALNIGCLPFSVCCTVWPCLAALRADVLNSLLHLLRAVRVVPSAGDILWSSSFVMPHSVFALFPVMFEVVQSNTYVYGINRGKKGVGLCV